MVHPGGFEPPTARFVAEYSIQLSYGCIELILVQRRVLTTHHERNCSFTLASPFRMVHPGGFEPPTARFVAEYSIQLSYGCIELILVQRRVLTTHHERNCSFTLASPFRMVHPGGFEPPTARFVAEYSIQLSYGCIELILVQRRVLTTHHERNCSFTLASPFRMVHPGGFEPPTARFVAEYSIQLSYGCIEIILVQRRVLTTHHERNCSFTLASPFRMVHPGGFEPPTARFVAEYSIQLSYGCIGNGGEAGIRTPDAAFDRILP